ncbi:MAG: response regulator, partial [Cytophagales bacterium]|nr:response regulator [Cytophagales bacterium]
MFAAVWQKLSNIGRESDNPVQPLDSNLIAFINQVAIIGILTLLVNMLIGLFFGNVVFAGLVLLSTAFFLPIWWLNSLTWHRWARTYASIAMYSLVIFVDTVILDGYTETYLYCIPYTIAFFALFRKENTWELWVHIIVNALIFIGLANSKFGLNWGALLPQNRYLMILSARLGSMSAAVVGLMVWFNFQERSAQIIRKQQQFYENIIDSISLPIAVFDSHQRFRIANQAFFENSSLRHEMIGKTETEYAALTGSYKERADYRAKMLTRCFETRHRVLFEEQFESNGYKKTNIGVMLPIATENGERLVVVYFIDVSAMRRYQEQLLQSQKTFEAVFENATDALLLIDTESTIIENCNAAAIALFGYTSKYDLQGKPVDETLLSVPEELHREVVRGISEKGKWENEHVYTRTDGSTFVGGVAVTRFMMQNRQLTLLRITDLTTQKEAQRAIAEALRSAREAAEAKSQFLSKISHEIRTPLNAIVGLGKLMLEDASAICLENIEVVYNASVSLLEMVNEILSFSKLEANEEILRERPIDWRALLQQIVARMRWQAERKGLLLLVETEPHIPSILLADMLRMEQIINNLLSNAIKFTSQGYVKITVAGEPVNPNAYRLYFRVIDTGIGVPNEKKGIIFESFRQASEEIAYQFGGTGLGLAIAKQLVQMMSGNISVEDNPEGGSIFMFDVLLQLPEKLVENRQTTTMSDDGTTHNLQGLCILMAEDNTVNQFVAKQIMGRWNVNLTFANNGQEALELLTKNRYQIVLMDLQMPVMDGIEATKRIRSAPPDSGIDSNIPIIALTADAMPETREKVKKAGMNDIVVKPFDSESLYTLIKTYA